MSAGGGQRERTLSGETARQGGATALNRSRVQRLESFTLTPRGSRPTTALCFHALDRMSPARFFRKHAPVALFGLMWSAMVCVFVLDLAHEWILGHRSNHYAATPGTMLHSALTESSDEGSTSYGVEVAYEYTAGGTRHEGHDFRYGPLTNRSRAVVEGFVARFPQGTPVVVFYDPSAPERAVLRPGVSRQLYFGVPFMFPFVMGALLWAAWGVREFRLECRGHPESGLSTSTRGMATVVDLDGGEALIVAGSGAAVVSVVLMIAGAIAGASNTPWLALLLLGLELTVFGVVFMLLRRRAGRLQVDKKGRQLTLRSSTGEQSWTFAELRGLWVRPESGPIAAQKAAPSHAVALGLEGPEGLHDVELRTWSRLERAERFRGWLAAQLPDDLPAVAPPSLLESQKACADSLPRVWRKPPSWFGIVFGFTLSLPFSFVTLLVVTSIALDKSGAGLFLALPFALVGPFLLVSTLRSLDMRLRGDARAFVAHADALFWGELKCGESIDVLRARVNATPKPSRKQGYLIRSEICELLYACGGDDDEVYARLASGQRVQLPQDLLWGDAMYEFAALVRKNFPEVVLVNQGTRAAAR